MHSTKQKIIILENHNLISLVASFSNLLTTQIGVEELKQKDLPFGKDRHN